MPSYYYKRSASNPSTRGNSIRDPGTEQHTPRHKRSIYHMIRDTSANPNSTPETTNNTTTPFPTWGYGVIAAVVIVLCLILGAYFITRRSANQKGKEEKDAKTRREGIDGVASKVSHKDIEVTVESRRLSESTTRSNVEDGDSTNKLTKHGDRELLGRDYWNQQQEPRGDLSAGGYRGQETGVDGHDLDLGLMGRSIPLALMRMTKSEQKALNKVPKALKNLPLIQVNEKGELEPVKKKKPPTIVTSGTSSRSEFENIDLEKQTSVSA